MSATAVTTSEKERALRERQLWEALTAEERKQYHGLREFIAHVDPSTSNYEVAMRSRLLLAGDRADVFWEKMDKQGMSLATARRLLRDSEVRWRQEQSRRSLEAVIAEVIQEYEASGHERFVGGKVVRTRGTLQHRVAKIANRESEPPPPAAAAPGGGKHRARSRQSIREAVAVWMSESLPKNDERTDKFVTDCMREIDAVLDSFLSRFRPQKVDKERLHQACDLLNIPRPKWGTRADQQRAWKHRKAALASTHPDALGHNGSVEAFHAINSAYDTLVSYNDNIARGATPGGGA